MMLFTHDGRQVFYKGKTIFTAPAEVWKILTPVDTDKVIVGYHSDEFLPWPLEVHPIKTIFDDDIHTLVNRNAFLINYKGDVLWRIENPYRQESRYAHVYPRKEKWVAYMGRGYELDLDITTGKVSNAVFTK